MYSPDTEAQIAVWRARALSGELTQEELREAARIMREDRQSALAAATATRKRTKAKPAAVPSAEELERELGIL